MVKIHHRTLTFLTLLGVHFSGVKDVHIIVQLSPRSSPDLFPSPQTETQLMCRESPTLTSPKPLVTTTFLFLMNLTLPGTSYKWIHFLSFCAWLVSLDVMFLRFMYRVSKFHSFSRLNNTLLNVYTTLCSPFHLLIGI